MARDEIVIRKCKDPLLWYNDKIDRVFEVIEYDALTKVYWVAAGTGRNIVYEEDCKPWGLSDAVKAAGEAMNSADLFGDRVTCKAYPDNVEKPLHYTAGHIECIDAIKAATTQEEFEGFLRGNVLKYLWRCNLKSNKTEDLNKARWYLNRLIEETDK